MTIIVDNTPVETSKRVEQIPKELLDFALAHKSTNGDIYWKTYSGCAVDGRAPYRLDNVQFIVRKWDWKKNTRVVSIKFSFSRPNRYMILDNWRVLASASSVTDGRFASIDECCYKHGFAEYDCYYVNLYENVDVCTMLLKLTVEDNFPVAFLDSIQYLD